MNEREAEIANLKNKLAEINALRSQFDEASNALASEQESSRELRSYNEKQAAEIARLSQELRKTSSYEQELAARAQDLKEMQERSEQQTKAFAEQRNEVQRLRVQLSDYESDKKRLGVATERVASITAERQRLAETHVDLEKQIKKLTTQVGLHSNTADDLRRQLETKTKAYEKAISDSREFATNLQKQQTAIQSLEKDLVSAKRLHPENQNLKGKIAELTSALKDLSSEHENSLSANAKAQRTIRDLQNEVHECTQVIRELRRPRGSILKFGRGDDENQKAA